MSIKTIEQEMLATLGGPKAVDVPDPKLFHWPIVTEEDEQAVIEVMRSGNMSGLDITAQFEQEFAEWIGAEYALAYPNGTMALTAAMYGLGVSRGDEIIVPSMTFWASAAQVMAIGGTPVFADIDPKTLTIDPVDIERRISPRTKVIVVVHYGGHPCDMDAIMAIADKHNVKVLEDVSHSHGALYKGRKVGTLGHASAMSMMAAKSFSIGEGGMLVTDDRMVLERAAIFANYARHKELITLPELKRGVGIPWGGMKGRLNQMCAAMGRVQLKHYDERIAQIQNALNRFWDLLEDVPGLRAHRTDPSSDSTMGGWYAPRGIYVPEELGGLPIERFCEAVREEGVATATGRNVPLHTHPLFNEIDVYGDGRPTRIAFSDRDVRQSEDSLPATQRAFHNTFNVPWFKHDWPEVIERHALAFRKVALQADQLI